MSGRLTQKKRRYYSRLARHIPPQSLYSCERMSIAINTWIPLPVDVQTYVRTNKQRRSELLLPVCLSLSYIDWRPMDGLMHLDIRMYVRRVRLDSQKPRKPIYCTDVGYTYIFSVFDKHTYIWHSISCTCSFADGSMIAGAATKCLLSRNFCGCISR